MQLQDFKVLTFDVVGTLIDFERGMCVHQQRLDRCLRAQAADRLDRNSCRSGDDLGTGVAAIPPLTAAHGVE